MAILGYEKAFFDKLIWGFLWNMTSSPSSGSSWKSQTIILIMLQTNIHCCNTNMFLMFFDFSIHWLTIIGINPFSIQIHDLHRINPARVVDPHENCHGHNQFSSRNPHDQQGKKNILYHIQKQHHSLYIVLWCSDKKQLHLPRKNSCSSHHFQGSESGTETSRSRLECTENPARRSTRRPLGPCCLSRWCWPFKE